MTKLYNGIKKFIGEGKVVIAGVALGTGLFMSGCEKEVVAPDVTTVTVTIDDPSSGTVTITPSTQTPDVTTQTPDTTVVEPENDDKTNTDTTTTNPDNNGNDEIKDDQVNETKEDYSAQHIMDLIEDTAFYAPSFKEQQIAAIVIGINLDHISNEDMDILSEKYGQSLEDFSKSYVDGLYYMNDLAANYREMQFGRKYNEELCDIYEDEKIDFKHMVISEEYMDIAQISENSYYVYLRPFQITDTDYEKMDNLEKKCSEEKAFTDLMNANWQLDNYGIVNPYTNVLELNMTK